MSDPYRKYDGLSYREIYWRLRYRETPEEMIEQTVAAIREYRRERTTAKAKLRELDKQWGEVIASLQHERKIVRSMMRYKTTTPTPERDEYLNAYAEVLTKLYDKMTAKRRLHRELPEHSHWTDFVPEKIKEAFRLASDGIPPRQKAKHKEPFKRTDPMQLSDLRRGRLLRHIAKELDTTISNLDADPNNERLARKEHLLRIAHKRTKALPPDAHVPQHWTALVQDLIEQAKDKEKGEE